MRGHWKKHAAEIIWNDIRRVVSMIPDNFKSPWVWLVMMSMIPDILQKNISKNDEYDSGW